jgi:hypothetical protein
VNHVLNVDASKLRWTMAAVTARFAFVRAADAEASDTEDSVLQRAAVYPE